MKESSHLSFEILEKILGPSNTVPATPDGTRSRAFFINTPPAYNTPALFLPPWLKMRPISQKLRYAGTKIPSLSPQIVTFYKATSIDTFHRFV